MPNTVFTDVQILDGSGGDTHGGEVLVQGNRIKEIDGAGVTLIHGPLQSHAHLSFTIKEGCLAELLLVDGDPLADLSILLQDHSRLLGIIKDGSFHKRPAADLAPSARWSEVARI